MRIGFLLPTNVAIGNPGNGVAEQARQQASALERRGHSVIRLNAWKWQDRSDIDVLHFFQGGPAFSGIELLFRPRDPGILVFSPIIDSNRSQVMYRLAAALGSLVRPVRTIPAVLQEQARGSDLIICRSSHERRRICAGVGVAAGKVQVVLNGTAAPEDDTSGETETLAKMRLPEDFVLHVGAYTQTRKNVLRLLAAAELLRYPVVIAGSAGDGAAASEFNKFAARNSNIFVLGYVDAATRSGLYRRCRVFCLPSLHEGTGLAALEAAAHGAKIVITKNGGTRDYFGNLADYVDPFSVKSIAEGLAFAWDRPRSFALRDHVLKTLTWDASAAALEGAYALALSRKGRTL